MNTSVLKQIYACTQTHTQTHLHKHIHPHAHTCIQTHTHRETHTTMFYCYDLKTSSLQVNGIHAQNSGSDSFATLLLPRRRNQKGLETVGTAPIT